MNKSLFTSDRPDWETPPELFEAINSEFNFDLDVCASDTNHKIKNYYTIEDDALNQDWTKNRCWMNPPFGRVIGAWMEKAYKSALKGALVVCLVPARTDTKWWHDYAIKGQIRYKKGRIKFVGADSSAPFPSALIVFYPYCRKYEQVKIF